MDARQTKIVFGVILAVVLIWLGAPLLGSRQAAPVAAVQVRPQFDSVQAFQTTQEFITRFPRRVIGSIEARQSTGFLQKRLQDLGLKTSYAHFEATIAGRRQIGRNIYAFKQGQTAQILAVAAHYDTAGTTLHGAMDDGSGVGVMLELARVAASVPLRRSVLFVASDGEEWGMLGIRELVSSYPERDRIVAALSLDYVATGDLAEITLDTVGQFQGYTQPWLRVLARNAAGNEGVLISEPAGFQEHLERALLLSWTDQGPFLFAGIPALNLGSISRDHAREFTIYHTADDTIDNLKVESFGKYGRAAEHILYALDAMPSIPQEPMGSFRVIGDIFLSPPLVGFLHWLTLAPLLLLAYFHMTNHRQYLSLGRIQRELSNFLGTLFPLLLALPAIRILTFLRRLPRYSLYPATPRDPVLEHPAWGIILGILITMLVAAIGCYFLIRFLNRKLPRPDFHVSKTILLVILLITTVLASIYNAYWCVTFFLLPTWLWGLVGLGRGAGARAANRMIILSAGVLYLMVSWSYAKHLALDWKLVWYEVLALSTGIFSWKAYLLSSATLTVGIRFLTIQSQGTGD